uniref:FTH domain-containing protein n=1 Tax=Panagrellus redivivus TaxID=6233 RepID=A0A7E4VIT9_PANRE
MTDDHLKWHLLKEMSEILIKKLSITKDITPLSHFLMSGKEPSVAVRIFLSDVYIGESDSDRNTALPIQEYEECQKFTIRCNDTFYDIQPVYFQKLVLLLAQSVCVSTSRFHLECPNLENIALDMVDWAVDEIIQMVSNYVIPTVTSLEIVADAQCCTPIDFSELAPIPNIFPNIEKVSLQVEPFCGHESNELTLAAYKQMCEDFENFDPPFIFDFTYAPDNGFEHHEGLEVLLSSMELQKNVKNKLFWQFYKFRKSYPKKTLTIQYDE